MQNVWAVVDGLGFTLSVERCALLVASWMDEELEPRIGVFDSKAFLLSMGNPLCEGMFQVLVRNFTY